MDSIGYDPNIIPVVETHEFIIAITDILRENHNDAYQLVNNLQSTFQFIHACGLSLHGGYFNSDKAFGCPIFCMVEKIGEAEIFGRSLRP